MKWFWIILALLYLFSPYDLIPGVHPAAWIDDLAILFLLFRYLSRLNRTGSTRPPPGNGADQNHEQYRPHGSTGSPEHSNTPRTPHEILNVPPQADQTEIRSAYRKLANQYHPDKVSHLGKEFQELAERRFKEIQDAYDKLVR